MEDKSTILEPTVIAFLAVVATLLMWATKIKWLRGLSKWCAIITVIYVCIYIPVANRFAVSIIDFFKGILNQLLGTTF